MALQVGIFHLNKYCTNIKDILFIIFLYCGIFVVFLCIILTSKLPKLTRVSTKGCAPHLQLLRELLLTYWTFVVDDSSHLDIATQTPMTNCIAAGSRAAMPSEILLWRFHKYGGRESTHSWGFVIWHSSATNSRN